MCIWAACVRRGEGAPRAGQAQQRAEAEPLLDAINPKAQSSSGSCARRRDGAPHAGQAHQKVSRCHIIQ